MLGMTTGPLGVVLTWILRFAGLGQRGLRRRTQRYSPCRAGLLQKSLSRDLHLPEPVPRLKFIGPSANRCGFQVSGRRRSALPRISTWGVLAASELATKRNSPVVTLLQQQPPWAGLFVQATIGAIICGRRRSTSSVIARPLVSVVWAVKPSRRAARRGSPIEIRTSPHRADR